MSNLDWSTYLGETLLEMTLATSAAMILVMLLRRPVRAHFGASVAYALWLLVPASLLAVLLPAREVVLDAAPMVFLENGAWTVSGKVQTAVGAISTIEPIHWELPLWLLGVVIAASWFAWRQWRFQRGLGKLRAADDDARLLHAEAVSGLGASPRRVFVTLGRTDLTALFAAPQHRYLVRSVDPVEPEAAPHDATFVRDRGPFGIEEERRLFDAHLIDTVISKNSGGEATYAKITVARERGLPVIMVDRPADPVPGAAETVDEAMAQIAHALGLPVERGE